MTFTPTLLYYTVMSDGFVIKFMRNLMLIYLGSRFCCLAFPAHIAPVK